MPPYGISKKFLDYYSDFIRETQEGMLLTHTLFVCYAVCSNANFFHNCMTCESEAISNEASL